MSDDTIKTSREAYYWCLENGLISKRLQEVLAVMVDGGTYNQTTAHVAVVKSTGQVGLQKYSVSPRFAVLERMGLIREVGEGPCPMSGRSTMFYEAVACRPKMTEAEAMKAGRERESVPLLKQQITELKKQVGDLRELLQLRSASHTEMERRVKGAPVAVQTNLFA